MTKLGTHDPFFFALSEAKILLDFLPRLLYSDLVDASEAAKRIQVTIDRLSDDLGDARLELELLTETHKRILVLQNKTENTKFRLYVLLNLLSRKGDKLDIPTQYHAKLKYARKDQLPLWLYVQEYLRHCKRAKVGEIRDFLKTNKIEVERQHIEGVLKANPQRFAIHKEGREKFISLKGK